MLLVIDSGTLQAVATDGHRLSWASLEVAGDYQRQEVILPRKTVLELGKLLADVDDPVTIDILANQVRFRFANVELVSKVVDGKFPDYNRVIPTGHAQDRSSSRAPSCSRRCSARRSCPTRSSAACASCSAPTSSRSSARTASRRKPRKSSRSPTRAMRSTSVSTSPTCSMRCRTWRWSASTRVRRRQLERARHGPRSRRLQVRRHADAHLTGRRSHRRRPRCIARAPTAVVGADVFWRSGA